MLNYLNTALVFNPFLPFRNLPNISNDILASCFVFTIEFQYQKISIISKINMNIFSILFKNFYTLRI